MAKSKKKSKTALPKRIGGVRVPKALRKGRAGRFLGSPLGIALMSEAVVAAGAWAATKQAKPGSAVRRFADHPMASLRHLAGDIDDGRVASTDAMRGAFAAAAGAFAEALRHSADAMEPTSKKPSGARPAPAH